MDVFALTATLSLQADNFFSGLADAAEAMARFAADSVQVGAGFDASMSKVSAISGATADEFDALRELAREAGASTQYTAQDAADALTYMAMAGWKTEQMTSGLSGILDLAAASGEDLARTSDIVTDALTAFRMKAEDAGHFADILAAASSNSNTNVSMMGESFKYAASLAGTLGYSAEDTALALGLMANAGIKSSMSGTALRTMFRKLSGDIVITGDNLGEVTVSMTNADGTMKPLRKSLTELRAAFSGLTDEEKKSTAESLVGAYGMNGLLAVMNASEEDWNKLAAAIDNCNGAAQSMAETMMNNLSGSMKEWNSAVQDFQIALSDKLTPTIREFVDFGTKGMRDFTEAFEKDGLDGAIEVFGKFVEDGSAMIQEKLPIFQEKGTKILDAISKGIEVASPTIGLVIGTLGDMVGKFIGDNAPTITTTVTTFVKSLTPGIVAALKGVFAGVKESWPQIWEGIQDIAGEAINGIVDLVKEANPVIGGILERLVGDLGKAAETEKNVQKALSQGTEELVSNLDKNKNWLENTWDLLKAGMQSFADDAEDSMAKASDPVTNATSAISGGADVASSSLAELKNYVLDNYDAYGTFNDYITENATNALNALLPLADRDGDGYVTSSDHIDGTSTPAQQAYEMLMKLFTTDGEGNLTYSEHNALNAITVIEQVLKLIDQIKAEDGYTSHTSSTHDEITNHIDNYIVNKETGTTNAGGTSTTTSTGARVNNKKELSFAGIHAQSMFDGTILRGATMFGWDAQGRPQIGGGEGAEAVVGVNSLNQQIREAVRDGLSGIVGSIAQAIGGRNEQPVYVVLDTGELVGAIGGKMDAELGKIGAWKSGGAA